MLTFLISRQKRAALCIECVRTVSGLYPRRANFDPELLRAAEIASWRNLFGPDLERYEADGEPGTTHPWQSEPGVYYTAWRLWKLRDIRLADIWWKPWPPPGGDLELLTIDPDKHALPARPPVRLGVDKL